MLTCAEVSAPDAKGQANANGKRAMTDLRSNRSLAQQWVDRVAGREQD